MRGSSVMRDAELETERGTVTCGRINVAVMRVNVFQLDLDKSIAFRFRARDSTFTVACTHLNLTSSLLLSFAWLTQTGVKQLGTIELAV
jgi:hypothetical protein